MMKPLLWFAGVLLLVPVTAAQDVTDDPSSEVLQSCILGADAATWNALDLTTDQLERVRHIQEACAEECNVEGARKPAGRTITSSDGSTVVSELKNVLSPEQYATWVAWCRERSGVGPPAK